MTAPRTMFEKIWQRHVVVDRPDGYTLLYVDRHLMHDGSSPAYTRLKARGMGLRRADRAAATPDHYVKTDSRTKDVPDPDHRRLLNDITTNCNEAGVTLFDLGDVRQGIIHVVGPEQGLSQPGITLVCGDSHTSTHGALGALAFGIGSSEVTHVMATQCLWQRKPKSMRITVEGTLSPHITGKDIILAIIGKIGAAGAVGYVMEYAGSAIRNLSMEGRLTLCNMSIEAGARSGMIAPDTTTFEYVKGRPYAPNGPAWDAALAAWSALTTDDGAQFEREVELTAADIAPIVTWGTSPQDALPITARIPDPSAVGDPSRRASMERALAYMGLTAGAPLAGTPVSRVFIGSCTNSRLEDLRAEAAVARGRRAAVPALVVPGSGGVKRAAEAEGLDRVFTEAGFEWREPGCSMCVGMNGDLAAAGERVASTSNRNFEGRQGKGARTHLVSPAMAAAAAVTGRLADVRQLV